MLGLKRLPWLADVTCATIGRRQEGVGVRRRMSHGPSLTETLANTSARRGEILKGSKGVYKWKTILTRIECQAEVWKQRNYQSSASRRPPKGDKKKGGLMIGISVRSSEGGIGEWKAPVARLYQVRSDVNASVKTRG